MEVTVFRLLRAPVPLFFARLLSEPPLHTPQTCIFRLILTDFPDVPIAANLRLLTKKNSESPDSLFVSRGSRFLPPSLADSRPHPFRKKRKKRQRP